MATGDKKRRLKIKKDVQNNYGKADQQWLGNEDDGTKVREVRQLKPKKASKAKKKKEKQIIQRPLKCVEFWALPLSNSYKSIRRDRDREKQTKER